MKESKEKFSGLKNRSPQVFERMHNEYKERLYNYLIVLTNHNPQVAEEIFSITIHSAFESVKKLKHNKNFFQ